MKLRLLCVFAIALLSGAACTPAQIAAWQSSVPSSGQSMNCHQAIDTYWPLASRSKAHQVAMRESHETATAKNRHSSASGCLQLLSMHHNLFERLGYSWGDRFNAQANVQAALLLYRGAGWRPWALTAY